jgi:hypothetical protein
MKYSRQQVADRRSVLLAGMLIARLGRNYQDICDTIREFMRRGVVIRTVINGITFDGATKDASVESVQDGCHVVDTANRPWPTGVAPRGGEFPVGQRVARSLPERWPAVLPRGGRHFIRGSRPSTRA